MPVWYVLATFVSAWLLFLVQPMMAKMILPRFGGTPAVWNTCMVFFQAALLAGYAYAHASVARLGLRRQALLHAGLLLCGGLALYFMTVPLDAHGWEPTPGYNPMPWLLELLLVSVGLPFLVVSTSAPLLQKWFAGSGHASARDPYFLYAASNCGSLLALVSYPVLIEPMLALRTQTYLWAGGYLVFVILMGICAMRVWRPASAVADLHTVHRKEASPPPPLTIGRRLRWLALAFVPSSLLLGVTTYVTTDLAPIPLLWVIPLALYLLSFILVFARLPAAIHRSVAVALPGVLLLQMLLQLIEKPRPVWVFLGLHLLAFFVTAMFCHGELARDRPAPQQLTEYYLWMSAGGVLGGLFNALLAPMLFPLVVEYPLVMVLACLLDSPPADKIPGPGWRDWGLPVGLGVAAALLILGLSIGAPRLGFAAATLLFGVPASICYLLTPKLSGRPIRFGLGIGVGMVAILLDASVNASDGKVIHRERSFFGVYRVILNDKGPYLDLFHGGILHGRQLRQADDRPVRHSKPLGYYYPTGPIGQVFQALRGSAACRHVALVGLGTGSLAYYGQLGQKFTFYEIDESVERLARNTNYFTYLEDSQADCDVVIGDARLALADAPDGNYGLIVVDAFSSDAIPVHLITRQAIQLYLKKLAPKGVLAFHISNRYLRLEPVMGELARDAGLVCRVQFDQKLLPDEQGKAISTWAVMARQEADLGKLAGDRRWGPAPRMPGRTVWTDDFSNLLGVFRWD